MAAESPPRLRLRLLTVLWVAVLWVPVVQMLFHPFPEGAGLRENRAKARPPIFSDGSFGSLRRFPAAFDRYLGDNLGFRESLIGTYASLLFRVLRTSPTDKVVLGEGDWLYYNAARDGDSLVDYCGLKPFSAGELERIQRNLATLAAQLRDRGILFALLVAPSKHTIYPEQLPEAVRVLAGETRLDQLARALADHPEIIFVDPRRAMLEAKGWSRLYFKTDTHWTGAGTFVAYRELLRALERAGTPVTLPDARDFQLERLAPGVRDIAAMLGVPGAEPEPDLFMRRRDRPAAALTVLPGVPGETPGRPAMLCESGSPGGLRMVVFQDSFGESLKPLLCADVSRGVFLWRATVDGAPLDAEKPSLVVLEVTERYLAHLSTQKPLPARTPPEPAPEALPRQGGREAGNFAR